MITPVILSGGSGTRLWPLSTPDRPKQFLPLLGQETLFHETLRRVQDSSRFTSPVVVSNFRHEALCMEELTSFSDSKLILEPIARNTAVAVVMAAALVARSAPETLLLIMPSDHRIGDVQAFHRAVEKASTIAREGRLVTFGIEPTGPETGYGYLEAGSPLGDDGAAWQVSRFKEKPGRDAAIQMLADGGHFWNGGIFLFRADAILNETERWAPNVYRCGTEAIAKASDEGAVIRPDRTTLEACPDISIDYAVMERSTSVAMVPLNADWSDVGSWDALADIAVNNSQASAASLESRNCFVRTDGVKVALLGVDDLIVVGQGDQIAIMKRGTSQGIKNLAALAANDY